MLCRPLLARCVRDFLLEDARVLLKDGLDKRVLADAGRTGDDQEQAAGAF